MAEPAGIIADAIKRLPGRRDGLCAQILAMHEGRNLREAIATTALKALAGAGWSIIPTAEYETLLGIAGTDAPNLPTLDQVRAYMRRTGWEEQVSGAAGARWLLRSVLYHIGVPDEDDRFLLAGVIRRVAAIEQRKAAAVIRDMRKEAG